MSLTSFKHVLIMGLIHEDKPMGLYHLILTHPHTHLGFKLNP